ncbi:MAG: sigma 54-dependent Fis family transcriptional regulator [Kofleriaceae bacterium]|nr:sigma 54-dependent Fis family transcriptional regulator [Kofleriaceae bacterium]MBP9171875.1 sigma 54-dependent Fis family transcriptional regulator [Kofleriaceae bacterium]MBP9858184.1 sigma 54-dependent Fis family transcriptional regulator [Kofleriaceae bacterium]
MTASSSTVTVQRPPVVDGPRGLVVEVLDRAAPTTWSGPRRCTIGSHPSNELVLDDPTVSRFHCELVVVGDRIRVVDLESRNRTRIGEVEVERALIAPGTRLRLGQSTVRVSLGAPELAPASEPTLRLHSLVGQAPATLALFDALRRVAPTEATVLLEGETGTGKEGAAEAIHLESARRHGPFVVVDCSAIPAGLIEAHLFGHEVGAFTGAGPARPGAFEEADGGSLFLDELGELSLELQPKLLRALESREVRRVGGRASRRVDVRVIAATNRNLRTEVNAGRFRADLFFRLAVVPIPLPPLRERRDDLPLLVEHFLDRLGAAPAVRATLTAPDFLAALAAAPWPGNVRELRNHLERCLVFQEARDPGALAPLASPTTDAAAPPRQGPPPYDEARRHAIAAFEQRYVTELLAAYPGQVAQAARHAGLNRAYLYRLLERHGGKR